LSTLPVLLRTILAYLEQMAVLAVPGVLGYFVFLPGRHQRLREKGLRSGFVREVGIALFVMTVCSILAVTLRPPGGWGASLPVRTHIWENVNLTPLRMIRVYQAYLRLGYEVDFIINLLGNILVFAPLGIFPALLFRKASWWRSMLVGGGISLFVECVQYFLMRQSDVDDVLLNTLGALVGYWIFLILRGCFSGFTANFLCKHIS
jgi:glycopeptide antibiotics resistance protein